MYDSCYDEHILLISATFTKILCKYNTLAKEIKILHPSVFTKRKGIFINFFRVLQGVYGSSSNWLQKHFHNGTSYSKQSIFCNFSP